MVRVQNRTGRTLSIPAGLAAGSCVSMAITLGLSMLLAQLVSSEKLGWENIGYGIIVILLTASAIGTKTACVMVRRRKLLLCTVSAMLYWLILLILTALFFGGQYSGIGVTGIIIIAASAIVCMGELKKETRQKSGGYGKKKRNSIYIRGSK